MKTKKRIMIACPNMGWIRPELKTALFTMVMKGSANYLIQQHDSKRVCNENNYMHIMKDFLESECEFLLQIDDDNPPVGNPLELIELDEDIIGLPTPYFKYAPDPDKDYSPVMWNVYKFDPEEEAYRPMKPGSGLQEVDAVGAGAILIKRRVFDNELMRREAWHRIWDKKGKYGVAKYGLDMAFCRRARKLGYKVHVHWGYPCDHFKEINVTQIILGFQQWQNIVNENIGTLKEQMEERWKNEIAHLA